MDLRPTVEARSDASPPTTTTHHGTALLSQPRSSETDCPAYHSPLPSSPPLSIVRPGPGGSPRFETSSATRTVAGIWQQQQRWIALLAPPPPLVPGRLSRVNGTHARHLSACGSLSSSVLALPTLAFVQSLRPRHLILKPLAAHACPSGEARLRLRVAGQVFLAPRLI